MGGVVKHQVQVQQSCCWWWWRGRGCLWQRSCVVKWSLFLCVYALLSYPMTNPRITCLPGRSALLPIPMGMWLRVMTVVIALFVMGMEQNGAVEVCDGCGYVRWWVWEHGHTLTARHMSTDMCGCGSHIIGDGNVIKGNNSGGCTVCNGDGAEWSSWVLWWVWACQACHPTGAHWAAGTDVAVMLLVMVMWSRVVTVVFAMGMEWNGAVEFCDGCGHIRWQLHVEQ